MSPLEDKPTGAVIRELAAAIVGATGFAAFVGWQLARGYFSVVGMTWVAYDLSVVQLLMWSEYAVGPFILAWIFAVAVFSSARAPAKPFERAVRILVWLVALCVGAVALVPSASWETTGRATVMRVALAMWSIAAAFLAAELTRPSSVANRTTDAEQDQEMYRPGTAVYSIVLLGMLLLPQLTGATMAHATLRRHPPTLPLVTLKDDPSAKGWYLWQTMDRGMLLVRLPFKVNDELETRFVTPSDLIAIKSW